MQRLPVLVVGVLVLFNSTANAERASNSRPSSPTIAERGTIRASHTNLLMEAMKGQTEEKKRELLQKAKEGDTRFIRNMLAEKPGGSEIIKKLEEIEKETDLSKKAEKNETYLRSVETSHPEVTKFMKDHASELGMPMEHFITHRAETAGANASQTLAMAEIGLTRNSEVAPEAQTSFELKKTSLLSESLLNALKVAHKTEGNDVKESIQRSVDKIESVLKEKSAEPDHKEVEAMTKILTGTGLAGRFGPEFFEIVNGMLKSKDADSKKAIEGLALKVISDYNIQFADGFAKSLADPQMLNKLKNLTEVNGLSVSEFSTAIAAKTKEVSELQTKILNAKKEGKTDSEALQKFAEESQKLNELILRVSNLLTKSGNSTQLAHIEQAAGNSAKQAIDALTEKFAELFMAEDGSLTRDKAMEKALYVICRCTGLGAKLLACKLPGSGTSPLPAHTSASN